MGAYNIDLATEMLNAHIQQQRLAMGELDRDEYEEEAL